MAEGMSVVVNVKLFLMSVMSPPPAFCNLSARTVVKLCTLGVCFRGELGFLNCDDIDMCVVNKQFELLEFVFDFVYVDRSMMRFLSLLLLGVWSCGRLWSVCEVVVVPYMECGGCCDCDACTVVVLNVCILRECEGARVTAMLVWLW